jgi:hypothetical protein
MHADCRQKMRRHEWNVLEFVFCLKTLILFASFSPPVCNEPRPPATGAILIAPLSCIVAMILGPSGKLSRLYAMWSRVAMINILVIARIIVDNLDFFNKVKESMYLCMFLFASRGLQVCLVDLYIAHIEKLRYTRGWDGIHTSLIKTKDNQVEIGCL